MQQIKVIIRVELCSQATIRVIELIIFYGHARYQGVL